MFADIFNLIIPIGYKEQSGTSIGNTPFKAAMGLLYGDNAASSINYTPHLVLSDPFTIVIWAYVYQVNARS